jgi:hypothetical protein
VANVRKKKKSSWYGAPSWTHTSSLISTPWANFFTQGERNESKLTLRRGIASRLTVWQPLAGARTRSLLCLGRQVASYLTGNRPWHAPIPAHRNNKSVHQWVAFWWSPLLHITVLFRRKMDSLQAAHITVILVQQVVVYVVFAWP